jgi:hypothetical protein
MPRFLQAVPNSPAKLAANRNLPANRSGAHKQAKPPVTHCRFSTDHLPFPILICSNNQIQRPENFAACSLSQISATSHAAFNRSAKRTNTPTSP